MQIPSFESEDTQIRDTFLDRIPASFFNILTAILSILLLTGIFAIGLEYWKIRGELEKVTDGLASSDRRFEAAEKGLAEIQQSLEADRQQAAKGMSELREQLEKTNQALELRVSDLKNVGLQLRNMNLVAVTNPPSTGSTANISAVPVAKADPAATQLASIQALTSLSTLPKGQQPSEQNLTELLDALGSDDPTITIASMKVLESLSDTVDLSTVFSRQKLPVLQTDPNQLKKGNKFFAPDTGFQYSTPKNARIVNARHVYSTLLHVDEFKDVMKAVFPNRGEDIVNTGLAEHWTSRNFYPKNGITGKAIGVIVLADSGANLFVIEVPSENEPLYIVVRAKGVFIEESV